MNRHQESKNTANAQRRPCGRSDDHGVATLLIPLFVALMFAVNFGCVSVNITPGEGEKSRGVSYVAPGASFAPVKSDRADAVWNNSVTGSTIAFQSSCGENADASLESIAQDLFAGFEDLKDLRSDRIPFDGREGLAREVEGKVDGVATRIHAVIYKKNKCSYVLTLVSLAKNLVADTSGKAATNGDTAAFERFTSNFKAP